jgi:hypothetical protein
LFAALAGLECMIRHEQNRTSTLKKAEFLPSLDAQSNIGSRALVAQLDLRDGRSKPVRR